MIEAKFLAPYTPLIARYCPRLKNYASVARFGVVLLIWGIAGYHYKVFMDLTIRGLITSTVFFVASATIVLGFKTRASMAALALSLLVHGYIFRHEPSLISAILALVAAVFPIGAYWSLDRYLAIKPRPVDYVPAEQPRPLRPPALMAIVFVSLATFIIGGPTYIQIFHNQSHLFRSWVMFQLIGDKLVNVQFTLMDGEKREKIDYMKVLEHKPRRGGVHSTRRGSAYQRDFRIVGEKHLDAVIGRLCERVESPSSLRAKAKIATIQRGWKPLYAGNELVCSGRVLEARP